ncbi:MAG: NAD/FAD-binding protein [Betaproteobacteria bacterium]|nr:NAD/FAD-binding protein [Betaproteobacteria bacterium]
MQRIAIIGSGISGLAAAHGLRGRANITLFESASYFGGHTHTVDITLPTPEGPRTRGVDTGFLVFNERTYPQLIKLFAELGVPSAKSDMSFSVQVPHRGGQLEWSGANLATVFAQPANALRPGFWRMLRDILRFNRICTGIAVRQAESELIQPLGAFLAQQGFSTEFRDWYFLPMLGCIWSCPTQQMLDFPVATMIRFCHNHGLMQVSDRPAWWTVPGGARQYVEKIVAQIPDRRLNTAVLNVRRDEQGVALQFRDSAGVHTERFDKVVFATHSDETLALLTDASTAEREVLSAVAYQPNVAVLHTDASVLPRRRAAWAAWNYQGGTGSGPTAQPRVCLHYLLNKLQPLPFAQAVLVSLNPLQAIDPALTLGRFHYAHPVFDMAAIRAQSQLPDVQGHKNTFFCGAWTGYGFHEDGLKSGVDVAARIAGGL